VKELVEIALFTDDVEAAKEFYGRLLGTAPQEEWPGGAVYAAGGAKLLVHERGPAPEGGPPNEDHFALGVSDVDAAAAGLESAGLTFLVAPRDFPWGRSAYLRDPDGRLVELSQSS
jgi:catechol 2,3-dioxygenase-like lactoylglutathione lyase family enzyme